MYAVFLTNLVFPKLIKEFGANVGSELIWEDDPDNKHRTHNVINTIDNFFAQRINIKEQSPKMADVWPIENVWSIIREKLGVEEFENVTKLKTSITREWKKITPELCEKLISSIGKRLKAVVGKEGAQITKQDYS